MCCSIYIYIHMTHIKFVPSFNNEGTDAYLTNVNNWNGGSKYFLVYKIVYAQRRNATKLDGCNNKIQSYIIGCNI